MAAKGRRLRHFTLLLPLLAAVGCGERQAEEPASGGEAASAEGAAADASGLTTEELENGIGPVREVALGPLDPALAAQGEQEFTNMCSSCHHLGDRYVGPPLAGVLQRRTPEFVMNMILNPQEMVERHPEVRAMLGEYYTPMPNLGLDETRARAIVEYLREAEAPPAP
jgi:mono/diheme cytochrome c family protein